MFQILGDLSFVETYKLFFGAEKILEYEEYVPLSKEDCHRMVELKKCDAHDMECNSNYCEFTDKVNLKQYEYSWLNTKRKLFTKCEISSQLITAETKEGKLYINAFSQNGCKAVDTFCRLKNEIIIWDKEIIHDCPFEIVKFSPLVNHDNILMNTKSQQLYQVTENLTICNGIPSLKTAEGFFLSRDTRLSNLKKASNDIKIIDGLILSEMDYQTQNLINLVTKMFQITNQKICEMYKTFVNLYSKLDDEFFTFYNFAGEEAILWSDQGKIFVPSCINTEEIDVIEETEKCYKDFPVKIKVNNKTVNAFLTNEKIIKVTSKICSCKNNYQTIHLYNSHRLLVKNGKKNNLGIRR